MKEEKLQFHGDVEKCYLPNRCSGEAMLCPIGPGSKSREADRNATSVKIRKLNDIDNFLRKKNLTRKLLDIFLV